MKTRTGLLFALLLPIVMLAASAARHHWQRTHGERIDLPIHGYDPRDLLSGHYLRYRVGYGVATCAQTPNLPTAGVCLKPRRAFFTGATPPRGCRLYLRGHCRRGRFEAGIERFYLPEANGVALEKRVRNHNAALRLAVTPEGEATIIDLLIEGRSWHESIPRRQTD